MATRDVLGVRRVMPRHVPRGFSKDELRQLREESGLGVAELARGAGISQQALRTWEAGTRVPQVDTLSRALEVLGKSISDVVYVPYEQRFPSDWRVLAGLLQPELARRAGLSTSMVQRIEAGQQPLTEVNAEKLSSVLGVDVGEYRAAYERVRTRPLGTSP